MKRRHMLKTGLALGALPTVSWAQTPSWPQRPVDRKSTRLNSSHT